MSDAIGEGATSKVYNSGAGWVRKVLKRPKAATPPALQVEYQNWLHDELEKPVYRHLFAPAARNPSEKSFEIEKIEAGGTPFDFEGATAEEEDEVVRLFRAAFKEGILLNDIEFYRQSDGRLAVVDTDKVCRLVDGEIRCPFPRSYTLSQLANQSYFSASLKRRIREVFGVKEGGRRLVRRTRRLVGKRKGTRRHPKNPHRLPSNKVLFTTGASK